MGENKQQYWNCKIGPTAKKFDAGYMESQIRRFFEAITGSKPLFVFDAWMDMDDLPEVYQSAIDNREPDCSKVTSRFTVAEVAALNTEILRLEANSVFLRNCMNCGLGTRPDMNSYPISVGCTLIESAAIKCRERNLCRWEESVRGLQK